MSSVDDAKDSPHLKEKALLSEGKPSESPVKQHGFTRRASCKIQQRAFFSGNILSFGCSVCKDDWTYSPNDLLKHFQLSHRGILPTYPCDLCGFFTNEFASLQRHRMEHKNPLVTCELCSDGHQYSLLLLTRHLVVRHSRNGKFRCNWCDFTTVDAGTFVQHIHHHNESPWKCPQCQHISLNEVDHQEHLKAHTLLHFICQICGYCSTTMNHLKRHAFCHNQQIHTNVRKTLEHGAAPANASQSCQNILMNICERQEMQTVPKLIGIPVILPNQNGRMKSEMRLEHSNQIVDSTTAKKDNLTVEQSPPALSLDNGGSQSNHNALTVLMVKNKISLPPNCTTKAMGFKVVDGKKHLVLKVIPVAKQNACPQDSSSVGIFDSSATSSEFFKHRDLDENSEQSAVESATSHCFAAPLGSGSCVPTEDIVAVKVKIEEEETSVFTLESPFHGDDFGAKCGDSVNGSLTSTADTIYPGTNILIPDVRRSPPSQTACAEFDVVSKSTLEKSETISKNGGKVSNVGVDSSTYHPLNVSPETFQTKSSSTTKIENREAVREGEITKTRKEHKETSVILTGNADQVIQRPPETTDSATAGIGYVNDDQHCQKHLKNSAPSAELDSPASFGESAMREQNSLNHRVFSFHNYSKDAFDISSSACDGMPGITAGGEMNGISNFALPLSEFSNPLEEVECPATDDENTDLVLEDFNVVKVEEELIPLSNNSQDKKSTSSVLDSFMEQHADAIITQLRKERIESSLSDDSSEQTESIVQNLKVQDEMQREVLKNNEQTLAQPMQIKATPSFQLITSCVNPQINVSYMKSRLVSERSPTGRTVLPKESNIGSLKPGASDKITLGSSTQTSISPHFLINSPNLKGSVLLSSKPLNNSKEKVPQTCYLVPRSIPLVQAPTSSVLMQASAKLNSRPVLSTPADKSHQMQTGRQTFLLRYISTPKSSILFNHQEIKSVPQSCHTWEKRANKVVYKIVRPPMSMLKSDPPSSSSHPLVLTNSPETQCVLMSSNKTNPNLSNNLEKIISQPNTAPNVPEPTPLLIKVSDGDRPRLAPRPIRPPSGRKIRRKVLFDELTTTAHKARRVANKVQTEKDTTVCWSPVSKEVERTLRLAPYNCLQQIKCPRRYQPVVVLNHPDADIPEVANIMKVIHRHRGAVAKVSLSQKTVKALAELGTLGGEMMTKDVLLQSKVPSPRAVQSSVRERFLLKLKLKKKSKKKYQVVEPLSRSRKKTVMFDCWFCGRLFSSQEQWIGHGQRHLMEATRDWNKLF
ncbi:zinc finger protein 518A [Corythoichthys intestinalis]|uniref:zinc finger protein 518A n=1 Tax=Corythoichthys intestinalis TaxID=161448 RepID=UPI0025A5364B|nr:zinc finger protein 518A [Corythoichthys intestinalis]